MVKTEKFIVIEIIRRTPMMEKLRFKGYQKKYKIRK